MSIKDDEHLTTYIPRALEQLNLDIQSIRRHLIFLEDKQDSHEAKTSELIHLYKGAGIIGKIMAWVIGIAGALGTLFLLLRDK